MKNSQFAEEQVAYALRWRRMIPVHGLPDFTMTDTPESTHDKRSISVRALVMVLMVIAFHIAGMLLAVGAVIQFVLALVSEGPNARLIGFGQSLGRYLGQVADFVSFATEEVPFPFSAWPST